MQEFLQSIDKLQANANQVIVFKTIDELGDLFINEAEKNFVESRFDDESVEYVHLQRIPRHLFLVKMPVSATVFQGDEKLRIIGDQLCAQINELKISEVGISGNPESILPLAEGLALSNYQFLKYKTAERKKPHSLQKILLEGVASEVVKSNNIILDAVFFARDLVNEPVIELNAEQLSSRLLKKAKESGAETEAFGKKKIESLQMGGLLAVNKGSIDPPTFTVLEWKPENAMNKVPYVLVGKGVVYDTGGMNLKTGTFMNDMKSDMGGAATMGAVLSAAAALKLAVWVIALIPATDNRCNGNAYVTGDVIRMHNGMTVEVLNTDAEGRMILADAISYAEKYNPELVMTAATLTGAAQRAIGKQALVAMGSNCDQAMSILKKSGEKTYERVVEFPFYDEYAEDLKSSIADMTNLGGAEGGAITAGKFLEKFTSHPFVHLDIAGVAFAEKKYQYRVQGGTGFGVRLLIDFFKNISNLHN